MFFEHLKISNENFLLFSFDQLEEESIQFQRLMWVWFGIKMPQTKYTNISFAKR